MNLKELAKQITRDIPAVMYALKDPETPVIAKILAAITVGYALSPIDLIPDFIPVIGYLDDLIILPLLIALTVKCIPKDIWEKSRAHAESVSLGEKKVYYAIPIIIIWIIIIWLIIRAFI